MAMPVVIAEPSSTMNITGLWIWWRGSSFTNDSLVACQTISFEELRGRRPPPQRGEWGTAITVVISAIKCKVRVEDVHARLSEEPEEAPVGVLVISS